MNVGHYDLIVDVQITEKFGKTTRQGEPKNVSQKMPAPTQSLCTPTQTHWMSIAWDGDASKSTWKGEGRADRWHGGKATSSIGQWSSNVWSTDNQWIGAEASSKYLWRIAQQSSDMWKGKGSGSPPEWPLPYLPRFPASRDREARTQENEIAITVHDVNY